jgi:hypothetical protein
MYGSRLPTYSAQVGFGYRDILVVGKYQQVTASAASKVVNIKIATHAEWKQSIFGIGIRKYLEQLPVYYELQYIILQADESISTSNPVMPILTSSNSISDHGFALCLGCAPEIIGPLGAFVELQWNCMFQEDKTSTNKSIPDLGGIFLSIGLHLTIY